MRRTGEIYFWTVVALAVIVTVVVLCIARDAHREIERNKAKEDGRFSTKSQDAELSVITDKLTGRQYLLVFKSQSSRPAVCIIELAPVPTEKNP